MEGDFAQNILNVLNSLFICLLVSPTLFPRLAKIFRPSRESGSISSPLSLVTLTPKGLERTGGGGSADLGWSGRRVMVKGESFSLLPDMHEVWVQIRVVRDADFLWILGGNVWH